MEKLITTKNLPHEEWLKWRKTGIGGSDAGAVCGLNPYRTALEVYLDKTTDSLEESDNEAMRQGREFEDYVARRFMEATGKKVRRANFMYYDEKNPFMLADVDRMEGINGVPASKSLYFRSLLQRLYNSCRKASV